MVEGLVLPERATRSLHQEVRLGVQICLLMLRVIDANSAHGVSSR